MVPLDPIHSLYRRVRAMASSGRAVRAHRARHHQPFAAVDRSACAAASIDLLGIAFIGESHPESERAICEIGRVHTARTAAAALAADAEARCATALPPRSSRRDFGP